MMLTEEEMSLPSADLMEEEKGISLTETSDEQQIQIEGGGSESRYPKTERKPPMYLSDYVSEISDQMLTEDIDYCYRTYDVPQTFKEAISSSNSDAWAKAMKEEIDSLNENDTFTLTCLPEGKHAVGGRWVYAIKNNADETKTFKARYVAKGYNQVMGVDYKETFSPTANLTSIHALMQVAAQHDLNVHQMDIKTAYLHAPIDCELYIEQPEGFEQRSDIGEKLVCKLNKSLYGLKQSGRNWNLMLSNHLCKNGFVQNPANHCMYTKQAGKERALLIIWVDDLQLTINYYPMPRKHLLQNSK